MSKTISLDLPEPLSVVRLLLRCISVMTRMPSRV